MGWVTLKEYVKECGCKCRDCENDVDRPFMCYTDWNTVIDKRCPEHEEQYKQQCIKDEEERIQGQKEKDAILKKINSHINEIRKVETENFVPIKLLVAKFREVVKVGNTDTYVRNDLKRALGNTLEIKFEKRRYYCSKEKLEKSDFNIFYPEGKRCGVNVDEWAHERRMGRMPSPDEEAKAKMPEMKIITITGEEIRGCGDVDELLKSKGIEKMVS